MEKLGLNLGFLIVQILAFGIIFITLRAWVYVPITGLLERRRKTIAHGVEDARIASEARANAEVEAERIISEAQAKAADIMRDASERAETVGRDIRATAEAEASRARESALGEVSQERNRMLGELRSQVIVLAMAAAQKLIGDSMDEKRQRSLLDEFFSGVKAGKLTLLEGETLAGEKAEVTSALPLTREEEETFKQSLKVNDLAFVVDPNLLGGVVVKVGDRVIDNSVAGKLQSLRQTLQK